MIIYSLTTFLSSFLSFFLQLMVGKIILPWFGGSTTIWSTLLFYFITMLLFGYLYVFFLSNLNTKKQKLIHSTLIKLVGIAILASLIFFKKLFPQDPTTIINLISSPSLQIVALISLTVGLPYLLLSTTSTLLQAWYTKLHPTKSPYFLYNLSNTGSLLGLLSYPFIFENWLTLRQQELTWSAGFIAFLVCYFLVTKSLITKKSLEQTKPEIVSRPKFLNWVLLSTVSNISLLATTSNITQSISPSPFLWLIPLTLFLISFILAFSGKWYQKGYHPALLSLTLLVLISSLNNYINFNSYWLRTGVILFTQFIINFVCHAELYKSRPKASSLVYFYLAISIGGVLGSLLCALIAPNFFSDYWEFPISLVLGILLYLLISLKQSRHWQQIGQHLFISTLLVYLSITYFSKVFDKVHNINAKVVLAQRNFYGTVKVVEDQIRDDSTQKNYLKRTLFNGSIDHGYQNFGPHNTYTPTIYYSPTSGIGDYIQKLNKGGAQRIGIVGLGTGALAGYCNKGDYYKFYEINPMVVDINKKYFTYIQNCIDKGGAVDIKIGDARISMQQEVKTAPQKFDVLVIDAFTDDAIPAHLMTEEALKLYLSHLSEDGVVAFHISNLYLKLDKVLDSLTAKNGLYSLGYNSSGSYWYFVSKNQTNIYTFDIQDPRKEQIKPWTDDFNNILKIIK